MREFERMLEERLQLAHQEGELNAAADPQALAIIASGILYTLAIRSRAGESKAALRAIVETAISLICGTPPAQGGKANAKARESPRR